VDGQTYVCKDGRAFETYFIQSSQSTQKSRPNLTVNELNFQRDGRPRCAVSTVATTDETSSLASVKQATVACLTLARLLVSSGVAPVVDADASNWHLHRLLVPPGEYD